MIPVRITEQITDKGNKLQLHLGIITKPLTCIQDTGNGIGVKMLFMYPCNQILIGLKL